MMTHATHSQSVMSMAVTRAGSPIIRFQLADAALWWRRADYLFGGGRLPVGAAGRCDLTALSAAAGL
jgi:hypothetical protein